MTPYMESLLLQNRWRAGSSPLWLPEGQTARVALCSLVITIFVAFSASAAAFPSPVGHVNDFAGMLSASTRPQLEQRLVTFEQQTGVEIAVATVENLNGDAIESVAEQMFQQWGIGKKGQDNGVLLLIAKNDHQSRIEVGYGLEGVLTDIGTSRIQREILVPAFQRGKSDDGVDLTVKEIERIVRGDAGAQGGPQQPRSSRRGGVTTDIVSFFLFVPFMLLSWLGAVLARTKSWWLGGVIGAVVGLSVGIVVWGMLTAFVGAVVLGILGTLFDFIVSRNYARRKQSGLTPSWWAGGRWGGGGWGSGGGFGGFGGGHSGGGGSSARW